ncbi:MAG TPA: D-cysteine desulfhydrase family protein, partial [bacterium]
MSFAFPDSLKLAHLPTPIARLERLSKTFEGPQIYIKRDDYTGMAATGNKIRKLEFLLAEALSQNCDYVITCGGVQSNHARATAVASAKVGLKCHLVLRNGISKNLEANAFLSRLVGAEMEFITTEEYQRIDEIMNRVAEDLRGKGHQPYVIPEGGSNELGALGYVKAAEEIARQIKVQRLKIHHIIVPVGSGGTQAGLLLGKHIYDLPAQIHGINVCDDEAFFVNRIHGIVKSAIKRFGLNLSVAKNEIRIIDGYVGKGYGLSSQEEIDLIKRAAQTEGIIFD